MLVKRIVIMQASIIPVITFLIFPTNCDVVGGDYKWNLRSGFIDRLIFSAQYVGTGKLYWNDKNTVNQHYYGLVNGKVSARMKRLTVDLWIKNATSKEYTHSTWNHLETLSDKKVNNDIWCYSFLFF